MKTIILSLYLLLFGYAEGLHADFNDGLKSYKKGDYKVAFKEWKISSSEDNARSQYFLGWLYYNGKGVIRDYNLAMKWYLKSAKQGYVSAQYSLGFIYDNGKIVPEDDKQAVEWYLKASEQGHAEAQLNLAVMYRNGTGASRDIEKARFWMEKSKDSGNKEAEKAWNSWKDSPKGTTKNQVSAEANKFAERWVLIFFILIFFISIFLLYKFIRKITLIILKNKD